MLSLPLEEEEEESPPSPMFFLLHHPPQPAPAKGGTNEHLLSRRYWGGRRRDNGGSHAANKKGKKGKGERVAAKVVQTWKKEGAKKRVAWFVITVSPLLPSFHFSAAKMNFSREPLLKVTLLTLLPSTSSSSRGAGDEREISRGG